MITVTLPPNSRRVMLRMVDINRLTQTGMTQGWQKLGESLKRDVKREILRKPKSGRLYIIRTRSGARRRHRASAPGETHANLSGKVRRSVGFRVSGSSEMRFGYGALGGRGRAPLYAKMLEFGTRRMKPRPSLQNAIKANIRNGQTYFGIEIRRAIIRNR